MKKIIINVPDHQFTSFMQMMNTLDFVQIENQDQLENSLTDEQKKAWENVKMEFKSQGLVEDDEEKTRPVEALLNGLD
ncbi:hypothetical protein [Persicitalea jodogahamensis]|uniref:Uncharacterized protein n=1 Tax=Persicitalea jodogahamensis TaxID=402147 RepID=A0A8J3D1W9_9BACT|nr:hypothetical protein [Persicitalea jodogahamensis]GHB65798.1 hypothetical protein GCM10007390_19890 [Persicitalea jodogahamensis]